MTEVEEDIVSKDENETILQVLSSEHSENQETITQRLKEFSFYLVENFELNLNFCLNLLEERSVPKKENSIHVTVLSAVTSAIPSYGKGISTAIQKGEIFILNKLDKKNSRKIADLVYFYSDNKDVIRELLIQSAIETFRVFEHQFAKVTCNGGPKRAMQKLATDASYRIFTYFLKEDETGDITSEKFSKGIIKGESKINKLGKKSGRHVTEDEIIWETSKLYTKVGIYFDDEETYFKNKLTNTKKYGHRKIFSWENKDDIKNNWEEDTFQSNPCYTLEITTELINLVSEYIISKNSTEEAKFEREKYHNESTDDRNVKQEEILRCVSENFEELFEDLETKYTMLLQHHIENKEVVDEIKDNQNQVILIHQDISTKLDEIHNDVIETKTNQDVLLGTNKNIEKQIVVLQKNQEDIEKSAILINKGVIDKINEDSKDTVKEVLKEIGQEKVEVVKTALRKIDPSSSVKKEVDRTLKKIRKLF